MRSAAWKPYSFPGMKVKDFHDFLKGTLSEEMKLKVKSKQNLWRLMFKLELKSVERRGRDNGEPEEIDVYSRASHQSSKDGEQCEV